MGSFGQSEFVSIDCLKFRMYSDEEIKKISVMRVTNHETFNNLGHISSNGLYDLRLGPIETNKDDLCLTCRLKSFYCAGHCGHIELPLPVYNPVFYDTIRQIVSHICLKCHRYIAKDEDILIFIYQIKLLKHGFVTEALELQNFMCQDSSDFDINEAKEVAIGTNDREIGDQDIRILRNVNDLQSNLEHYYAKVIQNGRCEDHVTSNVHAVELEIRKQFLFNARSRTNCPFCNCGLLKLVLQNSRFMKKNFSSKKKEDSKQKEGESDDEQIQNDVTVISDSQSYLTPKQIQLALQMCWKNEKDLLSCLYPILSVTQIKHPTDIFFLKNLLIIPPKFRPYNRQFDGLITEHESTPILKNVVKLAMYLIPVISMMSGSLIDIPGNLRKLLSEVSGKTNEEKCQNMWYQIQCNVDNLYDANLTSSRQVTTKGIRQVIEKKRGLMRFNLMGKRVNFSARSVAAPDPHLGVEEVGVPMDFALKLSYPVSVTDWNVEEMRKLVLNGAEKYPGALVIEDEEGKKVHLSKMDQTQRSALAKKLLTPVESHVKKVNAQKIIHRQLKNGDYVLMNRQPTLHRPSIQAHRVRVMAKDRVLRMPYANCKAYNADFDGDEFNMHFPQNELARSEAKHLIITHNQYLTPKDGSPLAGLIQDCVVSSVKITMRGNFFTREDYQQLVYVSLSDHVGKIKCLPPSILKPKPLWTGKQIMSTLLHNVIPSSKAKPSFTFKTSVKPDLWQKEEVRQWKAGGLPEKKREAMTESEFVMRDGELLSGVIDKSAIGSTSHGLIHTCYDLYGGSVAYKLLTAINRLCVGYLQWVGHTINVKDFITPTRVSKTRRKHLGSLIESVPSVVSGKLDILEKDFQDYFESAHMSHNQQNMAAIDAAYTGALGPTTSRVTAENERQLLRPNLDNHMKMMVDTGAKGSKVNMNQMASLFGSVAIDGKRMPLSVTGKSLPSFKAYESNPCAGGYIPNRFMTGINPKSYFFLCIVGRDSLQHTAVKTANSGYVQRCLIKHLEGIRVDYDMTVRNSDGLVLQFQYGEDGLDVTKVPFMANPSTVNVLIDNYSRLIDKSSLATAQSVGEKELVQKYKEKLKKARKKQCTAVKRQSAFLKFSRKMEDKVKMEGYNSGTGRSNASEEIQRLWHCLSPNKRMKYNEKVHLYPDPVDSVFSGAANLGVVSEALDALIDEYYEGYYTKRRLVEQKLNREEVARTIHMKALTSKVDPGEAVGALCAQALGEPLTQMTLNTFHFAGKDELNVTLGVPRMIEILRTGSKKISTPIMEVPFYPHVSRQQAEILRQRLSEVSLAQFLSVMNVVTKVEKTGMNKLQRTLKIRFTFLPYKEYKHLFAVTPSEILMYVEKYFLVNILKQIFKSLKQQKIYCSIGKEKKVRSKNEEDSDKVSGDEEGQQYESAAKNIGEEGSSDEDDSNDDDDEAKDGDVHALLKGKKAKDKDYSEDEDTAMSEDNSDGDEKGTDDNGSDEELQQTEKKHVPKVKKIKQTLTKEEVDERKTNVTNSCMWILDYDFDTEKQLWCEAEFMLPLVEGHYDIVSIVREQSQRALISHVSGIRRVFVVEKDNTLMLRTEGLNILKMFAYEHLLNVNKLYTNNIHHVAEMYGIEAAQRSIIREIRAVLSAYDIKINFRHLSLLADYFTCEGKYKACSRMSIATCASPIQKMSFETCIQFLKSAVLRDETERMNSPSASVALGQPPKVGTNTMHIRYAYSKLHL